MTTAWTDGNVITNTFMNQAQRRIEAVVHVEDPAFGAVGDGVTDDRAAIQLAFNTGKTVIFRHDATYLISTPLYLSNSDDDQVVETIEGNGATIKYVCPASSTASLSTMQAGLVALPTDTTITGEYSGWQGQINNLKLDVYGEAVGMYVYGSGGIMRNVTITAKDATVRGCFVGNNLVNWTFDRCFLDMRTVMTDTSGSGSFTTDANGDNIPSSFCIFLYPRWPGQVLGGYSWTSASTNHFFDGVYVRSSLIVGGYVGYFHAGGDSHTVHNVDGCEFAYCDTGMISPTVGTITDSWFENCKTYGLRVVGTSPPWHSGIATGGLTVKNCSFSPHNLATSKSIHFDVVAYNCTVLNCGFLDSASNVSSDSTTGNHLWLVGGYKLAGTDDFSTATLKIHYQNWMEDATHKIPDDIHITTAGKGLRIKEGSNARMGTSTLAAGTVVVANTSITANTRVFCNRTTTGGTPGHLSIVLNAGVGFTINSSSGTDTSTVAWLLMEPA
jgi:hypothetical protein